jgi:hypothetical protein
MKLRNWLLASAVILSALFMATPVSALRIGGPSDCDDNAIVRCGVHTITETIAAYDGSSYVRQVYSSFGISQSEIHNLASTAVAGKVTRSGEVFVDGQTEPVATGAMTGGRQNMSGSTKVTVGNTVFYKRPPSVSFQSSSLPAFVAMSNGRFQYAVIASCGNAVSATPTAKPKPAPQAPTSTPPAPAPTAPVQQQQQQQQQQQVTVVQPTAPAPTPTPAPAPASKPTTLVDTGPGSAAVLFIGASLLGVLAYRRWLVGRLASSL